MRVLDAKKSSGFPSLSEGVWPLCAWVDTSGLPNPRLSWGKSLWLRTSIG